MGSDSFNEVVALIGEAEKSSDVDTLVRATDMARELASRYLSGGPGWTQAQVELGRCLALIYRLSGDRRALDELIDVLRRAVAAGSPTYVSVASAWNNLGNAFADLYLDFGDVSGLAEAEASFRAALAVPALEELQRPVVVAGLSDVILQQASDGSDSSGLARVRDAVTLIRDEVRRMPAWHPAYPTVGGNLARLLVKVYESTSDHGALAEAEHALRDALEKSALPIDKAATAGQLCRVLHLRWGVTGDDRLFEDSVRAGRDAVRNAPQGFSSRPAYLHELATLYADKYLHAGDASSLDLAVDFYREALESIDDGAVNYSTMVEGLAETLMYTYHAVGDERALDESIVLRRVAVDKAMTADHRAIAGTNLAASLTTKCRVIRDGALLDKARRKLHAKLLDEAQGYQHAALQTIAIGDPQRYVALSVMGNIHYERFLGTRDPAWMDEAEPWFRQAVDAAVVGPDKARSFADLGQLLGERFDLNSDITTGFAAVDALRKALDLMPAEARDRDTAMINLAGTLIKIGRNGEAIDLLRETAYLPTAAPRAAAAAARWAGRLCARRGDAHGALGLYQRAVNLLPKVAPRGLTRADRERGLGDLTGVAGGAAAAAIEVGDVAEALVMVETARGILLSQALELRDSRDNLRTAAPELADRFETVRRALNMEPSPVTGPETHARANALAGHSALAGELDCVLADIRRIDGFAGFLGPRAIESIVNDAGQGSVVVLVLGTLRAHAIILQAGEYRAVALPNVTTDSLPQRTEAFLEAQGVATSDHVSAAQRLAAEEKLHDGLVWLWDNVAAPVLGHCGPRVWWVPTGLFALLPIHAAGRHREPGRRTVVDQVVSSYAPTVAALGRARRSPVVTTSSGTLVVAVPEVPSQPPLAFARGEARRVAVLAPGARLLEGPDATRAAVLRRLPGIRHFHYSGHAASSLLDGASARLLPHDWQVAPLTATDVAELSLHGADLAFLGGCDTALNGIKLADEAVTILAAFHLAGFRHVIGGLWALDDEQNATVAEQVWQHVGRHGTADVARALNDAVVALRDRWINYPSIWAGYQHVGP
ncbi:CHAT domain-containing protein [Dactylosporangium cerinum]|uniref:CHAT domain-containing protein n=1 Tax=Dactylosporangium cerinum TaxID=1434730 RepID=A0ABV9WKC6_9ACTN